MSQYTSAKGEVVDVNLIKMKHELFKSKINDKSKKREDYVNEKRRRTPSKRTEESLAKEAAVRQKMAESKLNRDTVALDIEAEEASSRQDILSVNLDNIPEPGKDQLDDSITVNPSKIVKGSRKIIKK